VNPLDDAIRRAAADLTTAGVRFAVVGGLAVSVRGEPRLTKDVDFAIAVAEDSESEAVVRGLLARGYSVLAQLEHEGTGRLATIRLAPPRRDRLFAVVDLLFASSGIEREIVQGASIETVLEGLNLPVASRAHLIAMKTLAFDARSRPQDWDDVRSMVRRANPGEIEAARAALRLIEARGFGRGKDLGSTFDALMR